MKPIMNLRFPEWHLTYRVAEQLLACEVQGFRSSRVDVSVLLGDGVASLDEWRSNVTDSVVVSSSWLQRFNEENSSLSLSSGI